MRDGWRDWGGRLPSLLRGAEALLLIAVLLLIARLVWIAATPAVPLDAPSSAHPLPLSPSARDALFQSFDPFFPDRTDGGDGGQLTSLSLRLFGTRVNEASGQGSAIIATPDGVQASFATGDAIVPGVVLRAVASDHVVLERGGVRESLFLEQGTAPASAQSLAPVPSVPLTSSRSDQAASAARFAPRAEAGRIDGLTVASVSGSPLAASGLQAGDVIVRIDGRPVSGPADVSALQSRLAAGGPAALLVERGSVTLPLNIGARPTQ